VTLPGVWGILEVRIHVNKPARKCLLEHSGARRPVSKAKQWKHADELVMDTLCHRPGITSTKSSTIHNRDRVGISVQKITPNYRKMNIGQPRTIQHCTCASAHLLSAYFCLKMPVTCAALPMELDLVSRRHTLTTAFLHSSLVPIL
jgi:hypothetical protein